MSSEKLTVLFTPLEGFGHINACHGIAEVLRDRGHRVVFAIDVMFKDKLKMYGFEEELHSNPLAGEVKVDFFTDFIEEHKEDFKLSPIKVAEELCIGGFVMLIDGLKARDSQYKQIIERVKPDLIVIDSYCGSPTLTNSGIPFVWLYSAAPLMALNSDKLPPGWSGLPLNGDKKVWIEFNKTLNQLFDSVFNKINAWYVSTGAPALPQSSTTAMHPRSEHLNIYMYPKELDYKELQPLPHNWKRVDGFVRTTGETFEIPVQLSERPGKLVFLSMGSMGCSHLELMRRLIDILSKSKHKYIVNKGPLHEKYELPANMWGQAFLPQTAVLPVVDLVITHGGNNTVTETFHFGKPMLVLPLFGDQFDNAQRLQETGLGLRLNPFFCSEEELLSAVDQLVNNTELCERMATIGKRMRKSNDKQMIAEMIENIVSKTKTTKK